MRKTIAALILAALQLGCIFPICISASEDTVDVIVELYAPEETDVRAYVTECAEIAGKLIGGCEPGYIYDTLFCGFHAEMTESSIAGLAQLGFVKNVYEAAQYEALEYSDQQTAMLPAAMAGYEAASKYGLTGDGIKVAVIDNGFDVTHPAFATEVTDVLCGGNDNPGKVFKHTYAATVVENADTLYRSSKLPFVFDYFGGDTNVFNSSSDHGTHVAGIIGAGITDITSMHGYAPGCQLLLMKIFGDDAKTASDQVLMAALEDAIKLGADVVNLSIGHYAGSANVNRIMGLNRLIEKAEAQGITVVCAAGNDGIATAKSQLAADGGIINPPAEYTDYGVLSSPASSNGTIAVASVNNGVYYGTYLHHADNGELYIPYTDTNLAGEVIPVHFSEYFDGRTLEYAVIPGVGEEKDYAGIDVTGKLVLVSRGIIPFVDKANIAASHGALGAVIYNNIPDEYINMELTGASIPAVSVSLEDGERLKAETVHALVFNSKVISVAHPEAPAAASSFSSRGTTPSLNLKPDIAGVGGSVYSTLNGGGYGGISGTSMASPQISGICALLKEQALKAGESDKAKIGTDIRNALLNSAIPTVQPNGTAYSPRTQGAGLVNLSAAIRRELEVTHTATGKPKIELGDGIDNTFSFDITVKNLTDREITSKIGMTLTHDGYTKLPGIESGYYSDLTATADTASVIRIGESGNINRHAADYAPLVIALAAGEEKILTVTATLDEEYHNSLSEVFVNGYYAEGYVYCETENTSVSLPYLGYVGDFGAAPILDGSIYDGEKIIFKGTRFFVALKDAFVNAGGNLFEDNKKYDINLVSFSPDGDGYADQLYFSSSFLRNSKKSKMTVLDGLGNKIYTLEMNYIQKTSGIDETTVFRYIWDGGDGIYDGYVMPDGEYEIVLEFTLDDGKDTLQTYSYKISLDSTAPTAESIIFSENSVEIIPSDENGIFAVRVYESDSEGAYSKRITEGPYIFYLSDYNGSSIYYEIVDCAYNTAVGILQLDGIKKQGGER